MQKTASFIVVLNTCFRLAFYLILAPFWNHVGNLLVPFGLLEFPGGPQGVPRRILGGPQVGLEASGPPFGNILPTETLPIRDKKNNQILHRLLMDFGLPRVTFWGSIWSVFRGTPRSGGPLGGTLLFFGVIFVDLWSIRLVSRFELGGVCFL